ncbi:hypothetical protein DSO57_1001234 [Entomophthora muscae]|uniref:Uncharacterized protein n=1 Tax=Entomophthora muscae TaxID=34485 RepID=A0ACC2SM26_9FUNG|nr:hypothetical protein DSO57_1001234 [Entomophthora muscae]
MDEKRGSFYEGKRPPKGLSLVLLSSAIPIVYRDNQVLGLSINPGFPSWSLPKNLPVSSRISLGVKEWCSTLQNLWSFPHFPSLLCSVHIIRVPELPGLFCYSNGEVQLGSSACWMPFLATPVPYPQRGFLVKHLTTDNANFLHVTAPAAAPGSGTGSPASLS